MNQILALREKRASLWDAAKSTATPTSVPTAP